LYRASHINRERVGIGRLRRSTRACTFELERRKSVRLPTKRSKPLVGAPLKRKIMSCWLMASPCQVVRGRGPAQA